MNPFSLIPIRDYIYGGVIVALAIFSAVEWRKHNVHEQKIGETRVITQNTKVAVAAEKQVAAATAVATTTEASNAKRFETSTAAHPAPAPGLRCRAASAPPGGIVPQASTGVAPGAHSAAPDGGVGPAFDPVPALLARAHAADAQIAYLQERVLELEAQMRNSP